jgi:hypothetical protein
MWAAALSDGDTRTPDVTCQPDPTAAGAHVACMCAVVQVYEALRFQRPCCKNAHPIILPRA